MLTALILLPLLAGVVLVLLPRSAQAFARPVALGVTGINLLMALAMFAQFDSAAGVQFVHKVNWVESLGLVYHVGLDGLNVGLVLMACIVAFAATLVSWDITRSEKEFYSLLLFMISGVVGAFASQDMFWFYVFHELALVPTFIMIGVWGRGTEKNYATFQITMYLTAGALIALAGLILLYVQMPVGARTFDIATMTAHFQANPIALGDQNFIFALLLFGFGILVSLWPFHTWAPLGYGSAPTANAMLHAGVLKKFGLYGLIKIALPMLPLGAKTWLPVLGLLCLGNLLFCGWVAMRQKDLNMLIGNSSVAHMGFCFLGIASLTLVGLTGTVMVMIAHGLLAALSYALTGYLHAQTGTLEMNKFGGLLRRMPFVGAMLVMAMMAGCGVPGFANFAGELMVLFGSWKSASAGAWLVTAAAWGALVIGGVYMLRAIRTVLHGPLPESCAAIPDAPMGRRFPYVLLLVALLVFGIHPGLLTTKIEPVTRQVVKWATVAKPTGTASVAALETPAGAKTP